MPSPTRPTGACCKVSHLQRHRAPPPPGSPPGLLTVTHQAPPVLPACSSRQECGVWQAELGNSRAVTEKGKKQAEQMCVQHGRGGRADSLGKYRHGLATSGCPRPGWASRLEDGRMLSPWKGSRWATALALSQPDLNLQPAVTHTLWDLVQMSFPLQPQFPHL